jgi:hypothetical protein
MVLMASKQQEIQRTAQGNLSNQAVTTAACSSPMKWSRQSLMIETIKSISALVSPKCGVNLSAFLPP